MTVQLISLIGLPTSGKTFAGRYVSKTFGIPFYPSPELTLASSAWPPWDRPSRYDKDVLALQLETDREISSLPPETHCVVVENWHFGNCVYAALRDPELVPKYRDILRQRLLEFDVKLLYFSLLPDDLAERWGDERISIWYTKWLDQLIKLKREFPVPIHNLYSDWPSQDPKMIERLNFLFTQELKIAK